MRRHRAQVGLAILAAACGARALDDIASTSDGTSELASGSASQSSSLSASGESDAETSEPPRPPDLGTNAVVCGEPGETAATDEAIAMLAGCEIHRGRVFIPHAGSGDFSPLSSLRIVNEEFGSLDPKLQTLEGLNQLQWVGTFQFSQGDLRDLSAMANLAGVDDVFFFFDMDELTDCHGLEGLRTVGGDVSFDLNAELTSLDGLSGLEWIGGDLHLILNPKLGTLSGLSSLRQVDGNVLIQLNDSLSQTEIDALLSRIEVGGDVILD